MQADHALHAYKPLLPAVKTGQPHGFVTPQRYIFFLYGQKLFVSPSMSVIFIICEIKVPYIVEQKFHNIRNKCFIYCETVISQAGNIRCMCRIVALR